jgi:hypothetical protein
LFLRGQCFDEIIQLIEAGFPNATLLLDPAHGLRKSVGTQLAHANTANFAGGHDLAHFEHPDMLHETGQSHLMTPREIANARRSVRELRYDRAPGAIRQGMKDIIKVSHLAN